MTPVRTIIHLDLDAFFCAVEERNNPSLLGKPFAVGGSPEARGVVASCSYPARRFGVRSAIPMARAVQLCPTLAIISGHYHDYTKASKGVMQHLFDLTPLVEQISIDEAFMDVSEKDEPGPEIAAALQEKILREEQLPCSLGVASNKLLAKIATEIAKASHQGEGPPNAIQVVPPGAEAKFLRPLPVQLLWGVGPKTAARLAEMKIQTIGDLADQPEDKLLALFGRNGHELYLHARGIDDRPLTIHHERKSISQETTFAKDISEAATLLETLERLSQQVSRSLVKRHLQGTTVRLKLRWSDFRTISRQTTLKQPTDQAGQIASSVRKLFQDAWEPGKPVRLLGVGVSGLLPRQFLLWEIPASSEAKLRENKLKAAVDELRNRFGDGVVHFGGDFHEGEA